MRNANRKHLLINLAAIGLNIILLVMLGWRTLLAQESGPYRQYLSLIRTLPHLASELEEWCIEEQATLPSCGTLTILSGEAINNIGTIINTCTGIYNGNPPVGNPIVQRPCRHLFSEVV